MGPTEWVLVGIASWFLIGYLNARLINDSPLGHLQACKIPNSCYHEEKSFRWERPVETDAGRNWFGVGVVLGPIGVLLPVFFLIGMLCEFLYERGAVPLGRLLAPRSKGG